MAAEFTERRQLVLKLVVQEFVETASAVSSDGLVRKYNLSFSSATVRNELAVLEDMGYLTHTHTSGGRVPTNAGYRFYVEHLMETVPLPPDEQRTIRHQFYQIGGELDQWLQLGASVLARTARNAAVVTPPRSYQARFKHLELIAVHDNTVLMVLVLDDGTVRQQTITTPGTYQQAELRALSERSNERCRYATLSTVEALRQVLPEANGTLPPHLGELEQHVMEMIAHTMRQLEDHVNRQIYSDGLIEMLEQPEFLPTLLRQDDVSHAIERMRQVLLTLTTNDQLSTLIVQALASDDVMVVIGEEHARDDLRDYSVILSRYGIEGEVIGVLGVIGPTRMAYPRSISTVNYLSTVLSDMISSRYIRNRADTSPSGASL